MTKIKKISGILGFCAGTLAGIFTGCGPAPQQTPQTPEGADQIRTKLNEGYSLLYGTVSQLKHTDKILLVKFESDPVHALITEISKYAASLEGQLEQLAKEHPVLHLELKVLPQIEVEARKSAQRERIRMLLAESGK